MYIPFDHDEYYKLFVCVYDLGTGKYYQSGVLHYWEETNPPSMSYSPNMHLLYSDTDKSLYFNNVILEYQSIVKERDGSITLTTKLSSVNGKIIDIIVPVTRFLLSSDLEK